MWLRDYVICLKRLIKTDHAVAKLVYIISAKRRNVKRVKGLHSLGLLNYHVIIPLITWLYPLWKTDLNGCLVVKSHLLIHSLLIPYISDNFTQHSLQTTNAKFEHPHINNRHRNLGHLITGVTTLLYKTAMERNNRCLWPTDLVSFRES